MPTSSLKSWILYVLGSILFLSLPVFSSPDFDWQFHFFSIELFRRSFFSYVLLLAFFYAQIYLLLPELYFKKRYTLFWSSILVAFLICSFLPNILITKHDFSAPPNFDNKVKHYLPPHNGSHFLFIVVSHFFQFTVVAVFSYAILVYARWKKAERAIVEAELAYLKAQINPHFLFNTLNSIYSLAIQKSEKTADAVAQLSGMMRYVLTDAAQQFVSLEKEIAYLSDYIALQSTRFSENVIFSFETIGTAEEQRIAPMLFVPLLENAFKYGVNPDEDCFIHILLEISDKYLTFEVKNKKVTINKEQYKSNKMGIQNVRKRLTTLYPNNSELLTHEDKDFFIATLKIFFE